MTRKRRFWQWILRLLGLSRDLADARYESVEFVSDGKEWRPLRRAQGVTLMRHLTVYAICRDHAGEAGPFAVNVSEARQRGLGFQFRFWRWVVGFSVHTSSERRKDV